MSAFFDFDHSNSSKREKQGIGIRSASAVLRKFDRVARCHGGGDTRSGIWTIRDQGPERVSRPQEVRLRSPISELQKRPFKFLEHTGCKRSPPDKPTGVASVYDTGPNLEVKTKLRFELAMLSALGCDVTKGVRAVNAQTRRSGPWGDSGHWWHRSGPARFWTHRNPKCLANDSRQRLQVPGSSIVCRPMVPLVPGCGF